MEELVILKGRHHEQGKVLVEREVALDDGVAHVPAPRMPAPWPPDCYQDRSFTGEKTTAFRTHHAMLGGGAAHTIRSHTRTPTTVPPPPHSVGGVLNFKRSPENS